MFGRDSVPRHVYDDLHARCVRLEGETVALRDQLVEALHELADAQRHAPRGETGRTKRAADAPPPPEPPAADPLPEKVVAAARAYAFDDPAQEARTLALAETWRAQGVEEREIILRITEGEHREPSEDAA